MILIYPTQTTHVVISDIFMSRDEILRKCVVFLQNFCLLFNYRKQ